MSLDVSVPDPPSLSGPQPGGEYEAIGTDAEAGEDDYRREEIERVLADGAWHDAFEEWTTHTDLTVADFETVLEAGLIDRFDFYWDPASDEVGYRSPTLPEDAGHDLDVASRNDVATELDELGRIVSEILENDYLRRDEETFGFFDDEAPEETFDYDENAPAESREEAFEYDEPAEDPAGGDDQR